MIEVKLSFKSIDEAIVALGKMAVAPNSSVGQQQSGPLIKGQVAGSSPASAATAATKPGRKPRADKGQSREPYGPRTDSTGASATVNPPTTPATAEPATTDAGKAAEGAANPMSTTADAPASAATAASSATTAPTLDDATKALEKVFSAHGMSAAQDLLARYGAKRLRDVKPDRYVEFIAHAASVADGGAV